MLILISGEAEVRRNQNGKTQLLRQVARGDVIGETGLLCHQKRMADIVATEDSEVLVVSERFIDLMQRRYPCIGAIFLNIAKIFATAWKRESSEVTELQDLD